MRRLLLFLVSILLLGTSQASAQGLDEGQSAASCRGDRISTADGCLRREVAARRIVRIVERERERLGLFAVLTRVEVSGRRVVARARGESVVGTPATPRMQYRIGSKAIPMLTTVLLQLQDEGRLSLDDLVSEYMPELPRADEITLRMLAASTSGYYDYAQGNDEFIDELLDQPFRFWRPQELLDIAVDRGFACDPGQCFSYSHANFIVLAEVLERITGTPMRQLINRRISRPLGLRHTDLSRRIAMPGPALHAFGADRGVYEDTTYWSPSWSIGSGTVATSRIADVAKIASAVGSGELLSRRSAREMRAPFFTDGSGRPASQPFFGLGVVVAGNWIVQNPLINGFAGIMAYQPKEKLTIVLESTMGPGAAADARNYSEDLFFELASYLAPDHPVPWGR